MTLHDKVILTFFITWIVAIIIALNVSLKAADTVNFIFIGIAVILAYLNNFTKVFR